MQNNKDKTINLCDDCVHRSTFPQCLPEPGDVEFGLGRGNDNIISCKNYEPFEIEKEDAKIKKTVIRKS